MAAPAGNQNAAKAKQWSAAIERALERRGDPSIDPDQPVARAPRIKALDDMAETFLTHVEASGIIGFKEMGDRLEGKPAQAIEMSGDLGIKRAVDLTDDQLAEIARASSPA